MPDLSVIIPARNEKWLTRTIQDVLEHIEADTEVIAVLDGAWSEPGIPQHERVTVVYLPESIGQRAATNLGAHISTATYICKLDGHCSVGQGFDRILIEAAKELGPDVTQIPAQKNLHVYTRICDKCGRQEYQGSESAPCVVCGETTWTLDVKWQPRGGTTTTAWSFTPEPKFQYDGAMGKRQQGDIQDVMSSLGACFFLSRERYQYLEGLDESYGSWGSVGVELACKSWLSGGRQIVNRRTHFAHFFRVGGVGFPYPITGSQQELARQRARDIWFSDSWGKQIRPLSWLIEKFWPINSWTESDRARVLAQGHSFRPVGVVVSPLISTATSQTSSSLASGDATERLSTVAVSAPDVLIPNTTATILDSGDKFQVDGITASPIATEMIELRNVSSEPFWNGRNEPRIEESVCELLRLPECERAISIFHPGSGPYPATVISDGDFSKEPADPYAVEMGNSEILSGSHASSSRDDVRSGAGRADTRSVPPILPKSPTKGVVFYSDCLPDPSILRAVQEQISLIAPGPIVAVTCDDKLIPSGFGFYLECDVKYIRLKEPRSYLTMFRQILAGLEAIQTEFVFFCEHDVLYHPSHFDFTPPNSTQVFYNQNVWKLDANSGKALHYRCSQTSGLCASRQLMVEHYRKRVAMVEADGFSRKMGFEAGTHRRAERVDDLTAQTWMSEYPNVDIRHGHCLTPSRWKKEQFRDQRYTAGWTESDSIPGWGVTKGRFREFLREAVGVQQAFA